jgi:large subunit ribosomal protein L24
MDQKRTKIRIKKGDSILVIAGKDRGKKGKVEKVIPKKKKIVVAGINILKKHVKPSPKVKQGGIVEFAAPLDISNVILLCPKCNKQTRISYKISKNGQKIRVCNKCGEGI